MLTYCRHLMSKLRLFLFIFWCQATRVLQVGFQCPTRWRMLGQVEQNSWWHRHIGDTYTTCRARRFVLHRRSGRMCRASNNRAATSETKVSRFWAYPWRWVNFSLVRRKRLNTPYSQNVFSGPGIDCEDDCILGFSIMWYHRNWLMLQRCFLSPSLGQWWR